MGKDCGIRGVDVREEAPCDLSKTYVVLQLNNSSPEMLKGKLVGFSHFLF